MKSQIDIIKGRINSTVGKVKQLAGKVINDKTLKNKGVAQENKGKSQKLKGAIKENIREGTRTVVGAIEKAGSELEVNGLKKASRKVEEIGNKIKQMAD